VSVELNKQHLSMYTFWRFMFSCLCSSTSRNKHNFISLYSVPTKGQQNCILSSTANVIHLPWKF